jgi:hypothetical protein
MSTSGRAMAAATSLVSSAGSTSTRRFLPAFADGDRAHHQPGAEPGGDRGLVVGQQLDHAGADVAEAEQGDADLAGGGAAPLGPGHDPPSAYE